MSELQKKIQRARRREGTGGMGFGAAKREAPRAMVLATLVTDEKGATAAIEAGADIVIVDGLDAPGAAAVVRAVGKGQAGVRLPTYGDAEAALLREAGCDFVVSPLASTAATAVDPETMGHVVEASSELPEATLRALAPLGLDGLFVAWPGGDLTLAQQLEFVRLSSQASSPLLVAIGPTSTIAELRVLRDAGAGVVVAPAGTSQEQVGELGELLRRVPPQGKSGERATVAIIPSPGKATGDQDEDDDDDE
jgi:2-keto-3-deoxy-6-phosphogluconate aldolase